MPMPRRLGATAVLLPLLVLLPYLLNGCAGIPYDYPRPVSSALYLPEATALGRKIQAQAVKHPGKSGFYLLPTGVDAFAARARLIDKAEKTLDLQYYMFHDDFTGDFLFDRILAAADRGVRVRLLLDDWHLTKESDFLTAALALHPNIEMRVYNPFGTQRSGLLGRAVKMAFGPERLRGRMHNKAFIVDNSVAIVGGRNIGDEYFGASDEANFYDMDIIVLGPMARQVSAIFDDYWNCVLAVPINALISFQPTAADLEKVRLKLKTQRERLEKSTFGLKVQESDLLKRIDAGTVPVVWGQGQVLADDPLKCIDADDPKRLTKMMRQLKGVLAKSQSEILMVSPYLVPGENGMRFIRELRDRFVTIKIITNSFLSNDVPVAQVGYMRYRRDLLRLGVQLYEIKPTLLHLQQHRDKVGDDVLRFFNSFIQGGGALLQRSASLIQIRGSSLQFGGSSRAALHAKTFILDRRAVFVGSFNFDPRSMRLDTQNGVVVYSPELANQTAWIFAEGASPARTYRVTLLGDYDLVWVTEEKGHEVRFYQEPRCRLFQIFAAECLAWVTPESML
jgi:putative cardiolipin synthase